MIIDQSSEYSMTSVGGMAPSSSLVVLTSPMVKGLRFEDLLRAPTKFLLKGKYGSLYKVMLEDGVTSAVKRIKYWAISSYDFKKRMQKIDQVKTSKCIASGCILSFKARETLCLQISTQWKSLQASSWVTK